MACWAYLKQDSELRDIFPTGSVPIVSIVPGIPREEGAPLCYWVKGSELNEEQVERLAQLIFEMWLPECSNMGQAREYVRNDLPLKATHFNGCGTDDHFQMPWGAAMNIGLRAKYEQSETR
jgi:hypothetical protein